MRWNFYKTRFEALCPADGEAITYSAQIAVEKMLRVEDINTFTASIREGFHEAIADILFERFGGLQCVKAEHQGVQITTFRDSDERHPKTREWVKDQLAAQA